MGENVLAVFISGCSPPCAPKTRSLSSNDSDLRNYILELGATPPEILEDRDFSRVFIPVLRADFEAIENFNWANPNLIHAPAYILNGRDDSRDMEHHLQWSKCAKLVEYHYFAGGHMYISDQQSAVAQLIMEKTEVV